MTKEEKQKRVNKKKRFNQTLAIVMVLFTLLPLGFSVYQSVSLVKEPTEAPIEEVPQVENIDEQVPQERSFMYRDQSETVEEAE